MRTFRALLEYAPDAIVVADSRGRIVLANANAEKLFGYAGEELVGEPVERLVPARLAARHAAHVNAYVASPHARPMGSGLELNGRRKDGSEFPVDVSLGPLQTEEGLLVASSIRDMTDRKRLEAELRRKNEELAEQYRRVQEASRLKGEFLARMSHELRTPLNGIIGFAELLHDGRLGPLSEPHVEYLGDILTSARHLLRLINDVLDLAKVEAGKMEFRPEPIDVGDVVAEVRDVLRVLAGSKRVRITTSIDPMLAKVVLDPARLRQVLYNFLSNALKFTPDEGWVVVRARTGEGGTFLLEVEDSGIGIGAEELPRLFSDFHQLDGGRTRKHQGTGLGLSLTRRIVEAQGGRVGVESRPGVGSRFFAVLPLVHRA
jgi:protein-histidine pros-kinase